MKFKKFIFILLFNFNLFLMSSEQNSKVLQSYIPEALFSSIILPYAFQVDESSPEALCESLHKYLSFMKQNYATYATIFKEIMQNKLLKKAVADINITDKNGNTALHFACQRGYIDVVNALIANDISINAWPVDESVLLKDLNEIRGKKISEEEKAQILNLCKKFLEHAKATNEYYCHYVKSIDEIGVSFDNIRIQCQYWHAIFDAVVNNKNDIVDVLKKQKLIISPRMAIRISIFSKTDEISFELSPFNLAIVNYLNFLGNNEILPTILDYALELDYKLNFINVDFNNCLIGVYSNS